jgi:MFS family permease
MRSAPFRLAPHHRVFGGFAIYAFGLGNMFPRLPDIKLAMGVQEGALGLGLIGTPVGTLIALTFASPLLERIGFRRALLTVIPLMAAGYAVAAWAPDPLTFFLLLVPVGLMIGSAEVILNVEADRTEHLVGFRIMNRAHSFWSIGFFGAGLFGAAIGQLGMSPQLHLALVVPLTALGVALLLGGYQPSPKRAEEAEHHAPRFARPTGPILVLVAVTLSAMLMEGASLDWSAIYMRNVFDSGPFLSGFAVAIFAFCQATSRFFADSFVDRHSPSGVARVLLCVMAVGVLCTFLSDLPVLSLLGFALIGVGCSAIFPLAVSAAAQRTDRAAAINVAALAQISFITFLVGPPLLGFVAEHWGIRAAFGLGLPLIVVSLLLAGALGSRPAEKAIPAERDKAPARPVQPEPAQSQ